MDDGNGVNEEIRAAEKLLADRRLKLKERFLREELSSDEYDKLNGVVEAELEMLEKKKEQYVKLKDDVETELDTLEKEKGRGEEDYGDGAEHVPAYKHKLPHEDEREELRTDGTGFFKYASFILLLLLLVSVGVNLGLYKPPFKGGTDTTALAEKSVAYINANLLGNGTKASLEGVQEINGVYKLELNVGGKSVESYATKDGALLFPYGIDLASLPLNGNNNGNSGANANTNVNTNRVVVSADNDASIGPSNAPVTIIEFSDFQCPYCARAEPALKEVLKAYNGKVRLVYRDFPLSFHQSAQKAAEAAECAKEQGKFWEYHDVLFDKQSEWSSVGVAKLREYAANLNLNTLQFNSCLDSGKYAAEVQKDFSDGQQAGVSGTPAFFINGILVSGAQPFSAFQQVIERELKGSGASAGSVREFSVNAFKFGYSPDTIAVNKGDNVRIKVSNVDVLHGIRIPDFNVQGNDVVEFTADKTGTFGWYCANFCGDGHAQMKGTLVVN